MTVVLEVRGLSKAFVHRGRKRTVLDAVNLRVDAGELLAVAGRSGAGKSTLLNLLGLLDRPDGGGVEIAGSPCGGLSARKATTVRAKSVGFVFQAMNLIPHLTVIDNVLVGAFPAGSVDRGRGMDLLEHVGLGEFTSRRAAELSLGEQQRVAVVRALVKQPVVILADEPTGSLDAEAERDVLGLLRTAADGGSAVVVVTHSREVAAFADRTVELTAGALAGDER